MVVVVLVVDFGAERRNGVGEREDGKVIWSEIEIGVVVVVEIVEISGYRGKKRHQRWKSKGIQRKMNRGGTSYPRIPSTIEYCLLIATASRLRANLKMRGTTSARSRIRRWDDDD